MKTTKYKHPLTHYAKSYNVSLSTVKRWSVAGYDLDDPESIQMEILDHKHTPENFTTTSASSVDEIAEEAAKAYQFHRSAFLDFAKVMCSNKPVEGMTLADTKRGHLWMMDFMILRFWKQIVLIMNGHRFEDVKDLNPESESGRSEGEAEKE